MAINNILKLPDELTLRIFSCLKEDPRSLGIISRVCKTWQVISADDSLWEPLFIRDFQWNPGKELNLKVRYQAELLFSPTKLTFSAFEYLYEDIESAMLIDSYDPLVIEKEDEFWNNFIVTNLKTEVSKTISFAAKRLVDKIEFARVQNGILIFGSHQNIGLFDSESGEHLDSLEGHKYEIKFYQIQGNLFATCSRDAVKVWDIQEGKCIQTIELDPKETYARDEDGETEVLVPEERSSKDTVISMLLKGSELVLGWGDGHVTFIDIKNKLCKRTYQIDPGAELVGNTQGKLITLSDEGTKPWVKVWDLEAKTPLDKVFLAFSVENCNKNLLALRGNILFLGNAQTGIIKGWNLEKGLVICELESTCEPLTKLHICGNHLLAVAENSSEKFLKILVFEMDELK